MKHLPPTKILPFLAIKHLTCSYGIRYSRTFPYHFSPSTPLTHHLTRPLQTSTPSLSLTTAPRFAPFTPPVSALIPTYRTSHKSFHPKHLTPLVTMYQPSYISER